MAFGQFARKQFIKTIDTGESTRMGSFKTLESGELQYIRPILYIENAPSLAGTEKIRLKVYSDSEYTSVLYTSDWSNLSDISGIGAVTTNWIGLIRITFNSENINKDITYYLGAEFTGYTRNGDTFFLGLAHDYPFARYQVGATLFYQTNLAFEIFKWVDANA